MSIRFLPVSQNIVPAFRGETKSANSTETELKNKALISYTDPSDKKSTSIVQGFKNLVATFKKFGITISEYIGSTFEGLGKGTFAGGVVYTALSLRNWAKGRGQKVVEGAAENAVKAFKPMSPKAKAIASALVGLATLGYSWYKASLNVSERKADVDHKYNTGHRVE